ncbi:hypothetical protein RVR_P2107 (plasmid) [Actinacidiphila reveromycinica]|uniref:Uncharacterized protein n=1 Tax=Actinacidiphila reveromycinica TaxID=659352 RepID=A0A7R6QI34_9ACTN|nr:hypothetical protein [Streptomyces sp. SN-593]BBG20790.1 hypothetical protein RVR_P2107 [Streptomyces sp. SN-593]
MTTVIDTQGHVLGIAAEGDTNDIIGSITETMRARMIMAEAGWGPIQSIELTPQITMHIGHSPLIFLFAPRNELAERLANSYGKTVSANGLAILTGPTLEQGQSMLMPSATLCEVYDRLAPIAQELSIELTHEMTDATEENKE